MSQDEKDVGTVEKPVVKPKSWRDHEGKIEVAMLVTFILCVLWVVLPSKGSPPPDKPGLVENAELRSIPKRSEALEALDTLISATPPAPPPYQSLVSVELAPHPTPVEMLALTVTTKDPSDALDQARNVLKINQDGWARRSYKVEVKITEY